MAHFDQLRDKFYLVRDRVEICHRKCSFLEERLRTLNVKSVTKTKKPGVRTYKPKKIVGKENSLGVYEDLVGDPTIPEGWSSAVKTMSEAFGDDVKATVYWAPDGRNCLSRRDALNYMVHRLNSPQSEVLMMRQGLLVDGWGELESLPKSWLAMKKPEGGLKFCTPDYVFCRNPKAALKYMLEKESQADIAVFVANHMIKGDPIAPEAISWLDTKNSLVPEGWRLAITTNSEGMKGQLILGPHGIALASVRTFRDILERAPGLTGEEREAIFHQLALANYKAELEGNPRWEKAEALPTGWMTIPSESIFLSPQGTIVRSKRGINDRLGYRHFMSKKKFKNDIKDEESKPLKKLKRDWQDNDPNLPDGWQWSKGKDAVHFKSPSGEIFRGRQEAIKSLMDNNSKEADIALMIKGLASDGWAENDSLPHGWMIRQVKKERFRDKNKVSGMRTEIWTEYLTDKMFLLVRMEALMSYMKENGYGTDDMDRLKNLKWTPDEDLPTGWMFKYNKSGYKVYINSGGKFFCGMSSVQRHMLNTNYSAEDLELGKAVLLKQGWKMSEFLPPGWLYKTVSYHSGVICLTQEYKMLSKKAQVLEQIKEFHPECLDLFRLNYESIVDRTLKDNKSTSSNTSNAPRSVFVGLQWENHPSLPTGWKLSPYKLKKGRNVGASRPRFLHSKTGRTFTCREAALAYIVNEGGGTDEEAVVMRKSFLEFGWEERDFLPKGWMLRESRGGREGKKITYLTPAGSKAVTREKVFAFMKEQGCSEKELDNFKENCSSIKYQNDAHLPQGWKRGLASVGKGKSVPRWLCPKGKLYNSRATAIRSILTEDVSNEEIEHFRKGLHTEGFSDDELPLGWMRKWGKASRGWMWVAPDFRVIRNQKELVMHLEENMKMERSSPEVAELVDVLMKNPPIEQIRRPVAKMKSDFDFAWREAEESDILPEGWKVIVSPSHWNHCDQTQSFQIALFTPALAEMAGCKYEKFLR